MGLVYVKNHHGPTPTPFKEIIDDMIEKKEIEITRVSSINIHRQNI